MKKIKLVVVDDDKSFLFLIQQPLKNEINLDVCTLCSSKKDAVTAARTYSPDLVLMDLNLESTWMDGVEAARTIRLETDARIIILTSYDQPEVILEACRQAFASAYVLKNQFSMLVPTIQTTFSGITPQSLFIYNAILEALFPAECSVFQQMLGRGRISERFLLALNHRLRQVNTMPDCHPLKFLIIHLSAIVCLV